MTPENCEAQWAEAAIDWALAHGLVVRPTPDKQAYFVNNAAVTHAPFALFPTPFPADEFEKAKGLQTSWNTLIHALSRDEQLIETVMETLGNDEFMQELYKIYKTVHQEGVVQTATLGIHRCDYLLHESPEQPEQPEPSGIKRVIKQVEFNTIASSFGSLSSITSQLHQYLGCTFPDYLKSKDIQLEQLPENTSLVAIADGLVSAWKHYMTKSRPSLKDGSNAHVLMIVQPGERNAFDQRWIEYRLMSKAGIRVLRRSLAYVADTAILDPNNKTMTIDGQEIAVTYFRAGYGPEDYTTTMDWDARLKIERSLSIKCPSAAYQLVGSKKVQQMLAIPGKLEQYVDEAKAKELRDTFVGLYPLDNTDVGEKAYSDALEDPSRFVLKPQREGGGNNLYGDDIRIELSRLSPKERNKYILMELINTLPLENVMVREGRRIPSKVISELGIYGVFLGDGNEGLVNETAGHLLRTKAHDTKEGGVAAGFAVIDSPVLI